MPRILVAIVFAFSALSLTLPVCAQSTDGRGTPPPDGTPVQPTTSLTGSGQQPVGQSAMGGTQPVVASRRPPEAPQSAEQIVAHHIEALGGKEKLQGLNSLYLEGKAILPSGLEINTRSWRVYDRLFRQELSFGESHIIIVATPGKGWAASPRTGGEFKALSPEDLKALRVEIDPAGPLADYSQKGFKLEKAGVDTINGEPCYKVKVSCPSNHSITYYIDENNWYVLRETRRGGGLVGCGSEITGWNGASDGSVTIDYADYKKGPGGYVLPYSITVSGLGVPITIQKVEINSTVDVDGLSRPNAR